jgi:hypothetical protein
MNQVRQICRGNTAIRVAVGGAGTFTPAKDAVDERNYVFIAHDFIAARVSSNLSIDPHRRREDCNKSPEGTDRGSPSVRISHPNAPH